jgi:type VI secretion system protein ImpJ
LQDRFLQDLMQFRIEAIAFRPWGFRELQLSHAALSAGAFAITGSSGIFSDGLPFDFPGSDKAPDAKPLAGYFTRDRDTLMVYLAVPQFHERGLNINSHHGDARYRPEAVLFHDENTGLSERPVQVARNNLRLLAGDDSQEGYVTLPAARVRRTETGSLEMDARFVPPLLDLYASDYLVSMVRRLIEILAARSGAIAGRRRQRNQSLADFTSADIASFWLLYSINTALPVIRHLFETRRGHPDKLFTAVVGLAGALTTFSPDIHSRDLPVYNHDNLGECFTALDEILRRLLDSVIPVNFVALPLRPVRNAIHAASLDDDKYLRSTQVYLAIRAETPPAEIIARAPQLVKVCSANQIEHLIKQALPGVSLTHVPLPPRAIPVKLDYQYFSISQGGAAWEAVIRARTIAAYVPADLPHPQLELIILLPSHPGLMQAS